MLGMRRSNSRRDGGRALRRRGSGVRGSGAGHLAFAATFDAACFSSETEPAHAAAAGGAPAAPTDAANALAVGAKCVSDLSDSGAASEARRGDADADFRARVYSPAAHGGYSAGACAVRPGYSGPG